MPGVGDALGVGPRPHRREAQSPTAVPGVGLEPTRSCRTEGFKPSASTDSATRAATHATCPAGPEPGAAPTTAVAGSRGPCRKYIGRTVSSTELRRRPWPAREVRAGRPCRRRRRLMSATTMAGSRGPCRAPVSAALPSGVGDGRGRLARSVPGHGGPRTGRRPLRRLGAPRRSPRAAARGSQPPVSLPPRCPRWPSRARRAGGPPRGVPDR